MSQDAAGNIFADNKNYRLNIEYKDFDSKYVDFIVSCLGVMCFGMFINFETIMSQNCPHTVKLYFKQNKKMFLPDMIKNIDADMSTQINNIFHSIANY